METFGQRLRRLRIEAGLSQSQLARLVPISQSTLSRYESGRQAVDDPAVADRLDDLLRADGELRTLRPSTATELALAPDDWPRIRRHIEYPSRVDAGTVDALARVLAAQRHLDDVLDPHLLFASTLAQAETVTGMVRHARGPHRDALTAVASQYAQFAGWLYAETRQAREAMRWLADAEELADEAGDGTLAAQACNFRGYLARHTGRPQAVVRWFLAEYHTPGAHPGQRVGAAAQAAHGYAQLGQRDEALRLLDAAGQLLDTASREAPPATAYWLTPTHHSLNLGLAHLALGDHAAAADHLERGLGGLPEDQAGALWTREYQDALDQARAAS